MEEAQASAYYDEVLQRGGGAARFKQGLGYGFEGGSTFILEAAERDSNSKADRLLSIRDKLKKRENEPVSRTWEKAPGGRKRDRRDPSRSPSPSLSPRAKRRARSKTR